MRQIVSLVKDGQVRFALVDEEDGSLVPFAEVLLPDPDRFGLHEAALLGTNLINTLSLNGKRPPPRVTAHVEEPPAAALPAASETARERRNRLAREKYHAQKHATANRSARGKPGVARSNTTKGGTQRYITPEEMIAIVNQHPEGITTAQISAHIWRNELGGGDGDPPRWMTQSLNNRQVMAEHNAKKYGSPLPYRVEYRDGVNANGMPSGKKTKYLLPVEEVPVEPPSVPVAT